MPRANRIDNVRTTPSAAGAAGATAVETKKENSPWWLEHDVIPRSHNTNSDDEESVYVEDDDNNNNEVNVNVHTQTTSKPKLKISITRTSSQTSHSSSQHGNSKNSKLGNTAPVTIVEQQEEKPLDLSRFQPIAQQHQQQHQRQKPSRKSTRSKSSSRKQSTSSQKHHSKMPESSDASSWSTSLQQMTTKLSSLSPSRKKKNTTNQPRRALVDDSSIDSAVLEVIQAQEAEAAAAAQFRASMGDATAAATSNRSVSSEKTLRESFSNIWSHTKAILPTRKSSKDPPTSSNRKTRSSRGNNHGESNKKHRSSSSSSKPSPLHRSSSTGSRTSHSTNSDSSYRRYTIKEVLLSMEESGTDLPPALERRVRDFGFAQRKRSERHGEQKPWGIFGLYAHLSDMRADLEWAEDAAWRRQTGEPYLSWTDFEKTRDSGIHNRPWFTYGIIALCTLMLIITWGMNGWRFEPLNVNPLIGPSSETLIKVGARQTDLIVNEGQWFRLFTPLVLHAGLIHYIINMLAVYFIGGALEQSHGFLHAAVLFCIPAVGGNILSAICLPQYISVGASGGIFGLIGGCLADISINWNLLFYKSTTDEADRGRHYKVLFWLAFDILINCIIGFTPFVDNFTHLGGLLYGLLCGLSTMDRLAVGFFGLSKEPKKAVWNSLMRFLGLILSVLSIMITTVILVQSDGTTSPCNGCRYISCVPFPPRANEKWWYCDDCDFVTADLFVDDATGQYEEIRVTCPDDSLERIDVTADQLFDREEVRKNLPSYCRNYCDEVFAT